MRAWVATMAALAVACAFGLLVRWAGAPWGGWVAGLAAAALVFVFLVPGMGERARQPPDAPERKVHFGD